MIVWTRGVHVISTRGVMGSPPVEKLTVFAVVNGEFEVLHVAVSDRVSLKLIKQ